MPARLPSLFPVLMAVALAAGPAWAKTSPEKVQAVYEDIAAGQSDATALYLRGEPEQALANLRRFEKQGDWLPSFVLGNMTWKMHPAESFAWHQQAAQWRGDAGPVNLELALHYTRREECEQAADAWRKVEKAGAFEGYFPAVAAYCQFKLGNDAAAIALFERAEFGAPGRFEGLLEEIWGPRPALVRHAEGLAAFRAGQDTDIEALINVSFAEGDGALLELIKASKQVAAAPESLRLLACLEPAIAARGKHIEKYGSGELPAYGQAWDADEAAVAEGWREALTKCGTVLPGQPLPASMALARNLIYLATQASLATQAQMLAAHGQALAQRANSSEGDFEALDTLAALQMGANDRAAVMQSDELGWQRYRSARYASSRVLGEVLKEGADPAAVAALARRAWNDFPDDALVLWLVLEKGGLTGDDRRRALRSQILAEFHGPTGEYLMHSGKSAIRLLQAVQAYRQVVESTPASAP